MKKSLINKRFSVLVSGNGTNLQSIIENVKSGFIPAELSVVISDSKEAFALERAKKANIPSFFVERKEISRAEHEEKILKIMRNYKIDFIVLAGYMRIIKHSLLEEYKDRIINIHPALLPSFPGQNGYEDTWNYGCKIGGCTVHFIDSGVDTGPIIAQGVLLRIPTDTFESFKKRGLEIEHYVFPRAIKAFAEGRVEIYTNETGKRVTRINE